MESTREKTADYVVQNLCTSTQSVKVPSLMMLNGEEMPAFGLGTWMIDAGLAKKVTEDAIDVGYRHFDCAYMYSNERDIGEGIAMKIAQGVVKRKDLFITSKLWCTWHEPEVVEEAIVLSLKNLQLDYLDLYLMHAPYAYKHSKSDLFPRIDGKLQFSDTDYLDTWFAMEKLVAKGLVRSIGVSNFNSQQLERVWSNGNIKPVVNQIECHPYLSQTKLSDFCKQLGVTVAAYSSLGNKGSPFHDPTELGVLDDQTVHHLAEKYGKSPGQILLRYQIDRGHLVIPKTSSPERLLENISIFDFQLQPEDVSALDLLNMERRYLNLKDSGNENLPKYYPFNIPY